MENQLAVAHTAAVEIIQTPLPAAENPALVYIGSLAAGSSQFSMECTLRKIAAQLGGDLFTAPWHLLRFAEVSRLRSILSEQHSAATVNKYLAALKGVARAAWNLNQMPHEEYLRIKEIKCVRGQTVPAGRPLEYSELEKLADSIAGDHGRKQALSARDAALFAVARNTGVRRAELVGFDVEDYRPDEKPNPSLLVRHGKGNKQRIVYLQADARDALDAWLLVRGSEPGPLFNRILKSGQPVMTRLTPQAVLKIFKRRARQACVEEFSPHDLRRTLVGDMLDAGVSVNVVASVVGHSSVNTTSRYDRRGEREKQRAAGAVRVPYVRPVV